MAPELHPNLHKALAASQPHDLTFGEWLDVTLELQRTAFGQDPPTLEDDERADWLMMNLFAMVTEVTEMSDEMGWKPWTHPRGWTNRDLVISEMADLFHFAGNILATIECTGEEFSVAYLEKVGKNYTRQAEGDDGISRRCPHCKRSLDDVGVRVIHHDDSQREDHLCAGCGGYLSPAFLNNLPGGVPK